ncbi:hypothetical protein [uncultured Jatrophihabitans sp.]|uniref:hypothetical protein n=1 Tax=uncultured Jatrophihabitans sp. TaxID=1610747 RepID=UPI0035CC18AC
MSGHKKDDPRVYTPNVTPQTAGHSVVIAPHKLEAAIKKFQQESVNQSPRHLKRTLESAMLSAGDFGSIPNASAVSKELMGFVSGHLAAMSTMGDVLADFVSRVQAAAELGRQADTETRSTMKQARGHGN